MYHLVGNADSRAGGSYAYGPWRGGGMWEISVPSSQFCCGHKTAILKTALKKKSNRIKPYNYNCIVGTLIYKNVIYLPIRAQRRWVGAKL